MSNLETKLALREAFRNHCHEENIYYRDVDSIRFLTKCPYCGDSSDPNHAHFYVIADPNTNTNAGYYCHKCGEHGAVTEETLILFGITDPNLRSSLITLNKTADKTARNGYLVDNKLQMFPFQTPPPYRGKKITYLEDRLQRSFQDDELNEMKVITSIHTFLDANDIHTYRFQKPIMNMLERDYVGFLTFGNSHILLRDITNFHDKRWVIYPIVQESTNNKVIYTIQSELDPLSTDPIEINISEGVLDIVSVCYLLGHKKPNTLNACVSGKYYEKFLLFLLDLGFAGSNITINVFADNDMAFNKKAKQPTDITYFQRIFKRFRYLYKEINIFYNVIGKDCGVPKDQIKLKKIKI